MNKLKAIPESVWDLRDRLQTSIDDICPSVAVDMIDVDVMLLRERLQKCICL